MDIAWTEVTVRELTDGYENNDEEGGVIGYGGNLDIRPPYQRQFIYKDKQREAVIETLIKGFPLNVMYWAVRDEGGYEVIDGQQRTISISQYVDGEFSFDGRYFHNLQADEKEQILNYKLTVYLCSGTDSEKLSWFETINIAGEELSDQELKNAVYSGPWVADAKRYFVRTNAAGYGLGSKYMRGDYRRGEFLETALKWINSGDVTDYMATHQHDPNANELWLYFKKVIDWTETTFPNYRSQMKGLAWGSFYNEFGEVALDSAALETQVSTLFADNDVTKKAGIYAYLLTGQEKWLNIRAFDSDARAEAYERQKGICPDCGEHFAIEEMEADHITPWRDGGKTNADNCQMLCRDDNRRKGAK